jgi:hypothetical protein
MKKILGAIAGALVLGVGCAHNQERPPQAEPSAPQASVDRAGDVRTMTSHSCEVLSTAPAGAQQTECMSNKSSARTAGNAAIRGSASRDAAASGSASSNVAVDDSGSGDAVIGGSVAQDEGIGGSASEDLATGNQASQNVGTGNPASQDAATGGSAAKDAAFENTDMGGTGGGGG